MKISPDLFLALKQVFPITVQMLDIALKNNSKSIVCKDSVKKMELFFHKEVLLHDKVFTRKQFFLHE